MLKNYRRQFVMSNMLLSGTVLLITFIILGVGMYRSDYSELENTMSIILKPWNSQSQRSQERTERGDAPDIEQGSAHRVNTADRPQSRPKNEPEPERGEAFTDIDLYANFITVFYDQRTNEMSYISGSDNIDDGIVSAAVDLVRRSPDKFGRVKEYRLFYYKEVTQREYKIAFVDYSYITSRVLKNVLFLTLVFIVSMAFIFQISLKLSADAVRPLESAIEMERNFVADISHDLKTPITVVLTNNSILKSNPDMPPDERSQWTSSTDMAAKNMMKLVNEMLTLSSLESIDRTVEKERVSLSSAAEKCVLQLESLAYEQNITITTDIADDIFVLSTAEYTERICSGLIDNALKYEPEGGVVEVSVSKSKRFARLTVRNRGSVISSDDLPHIFERFYRGDKARSPQKGHGLGLPIIKQITELISAQITVESSPSTGTVFNVDFESCE